MVAEETYNIIQANADQLNSSIIYDRDFTYVSASSCASPVYQHSC